jgi:hypothetical protein
MMSKSEKTLSTRVFGVEARLPEGVDSPYQLHLILGRVVPIDNGVESDRCSLPSRLTPRIVRNAHAAVLCVWALLESGGLGRCARF